MCSVPITAVDRLSVNTMLFSVITKGYLKTILFYLAIMHVMNTNTVIKNNFSQHAAPTLSHVPSRKSRPVYICRMITYLDTRKMC